MTRRLTIFFGNPKCIPYQILAAWVPSKDHHLNHTIGWVRMTGIKQGSQDCVNRIKISQHQSFQPM
jgi:hypothetical protein